MLGLLKRQVEASQSMIRIVGLSATLPNYKDVASFLGVTEPGLFYFDASYRPVPLAMQFIGATDKNILASKNVMDEVCFQKVGCCSWWCIATRVLLDMHMRPQPRKATSGVGSDFRSALLLRHM